MIFLLYKKLSFSFKLLENCFIFHLLYLNICQAQHNFDIVCPINKRDTFYDTNLKLNLFRKSEDWQKNECILKNLTYALERNIFIFNSSKKNDPSFENILKYDMTYINLIAAFQSEIRILNGFLYSSLNITMETGIHLVEYQHLERKDEELFRRMMVNITIQSTLANIILRTNQFYLFVSNFFIIKNIVFFGNDINLIENNNSSYYNNNYYICNELDLLNLSKKNCSLKNIILTDFITNMYGLFNVEYLYNTNMTNIFPYPVLQIINCSFININIALNKTGFTIFISLTPNAGYVFLINTTFKNIYFPQGLLRYSINKYDSLYLEKENIFDDFSSVNFTINIVNCKISFYNQYFIKNEQSYLINLDYFLGKFLMRDCKIINLYGINTIANLLRFDKEIKFINIKFINITQSSIMNLFSLDNMLLFNFTLDNYVSNNLIPFKIENLKKYELIFCTFTKIKLDKVSMLINIIDSGVYIIDSIIFDGYFNIFLYQFQRYLIIYNSTFEKIQFKDNLIYYEGDNCTIQNSIFNSIDGFVYFFVFIENNYINLKGNIIANSIIYSFFYVERSFFQINTELIIKNNFFMYLWEKDQSCMNVITNFTEIYNNIVGISFFRDLSVKNILFHLNNVYIINNDFLVLNSGGMVQMQEGICQYEKTIFINNYFLSTKFQYVFEYDIQVRVYISSCYLEDNGVIYKKDIYFIYTDNVVFSLWNLPYTLFNDIIMVISDKIEIVAGFISAAPHGGIFELYNSKFILFNIQNTVFEYKGIQLDHFLLAQLNNNSFYNLKCNNKSFANKHGGVSLLSSTDYTLTKGGNNFSISMKNNSFLNCQCINGGGLSIVGIMNVIIIDIYFQNSNADYLGGSMILAGIEKLILINVFIYNSIANDGGAIYIINILEILGNNILLENIISKNDGSIFLKNVNYLKFIDVKTKNTTALGGGGVFMIINTFFILNFLFVENSKSFFEGGVLLCKLKSNIELNFIFVNISASNEGGVISILNIIEFIILNLTVKDAKSEKQGAFAILISFEQGFFQNIILISTNSLQGRGSLCILNNENTGFIKIINLLCFNNFAIEGSCISYSSDCFLKMNSIKIYNNINKALFLEGNINLLIEIENLIICDSFSLDILIYLINIELYAQFWNIINNNSSIILSISDSKTQIEFINFDNNSFSYMIEAKVSILNISSLQIKSELSKILFFNFMDSTININNGELTNGNTNKNLVVCKNSHIQLYNLKFLNNIGQVLWFFNSYTFIYFCTFYNNTNNARLKSNDILVDSSGLNLSKIEIHYSIFNIFLEFSCQFSGYSIVHLSNNLFLNMNQKIEIHAIYIEIIVKLIISNDSYINFTDKSLQIHNENPFILLIYIFNSFFISNKANQGSSIYLIGNLELYIVNCTFKNNKAINKNKGLFEGVAPCIFFKPLFYYSKFEIFSSNFINNKAEYIAPTILTFSKVKIDKNTNFINNTDYINLTNNSFSYPIKILLKQYTSENKTFYYNDFDNTLFLINSGHSFKLEIGIYDFYNNLIVLDNQTFLTVKNSVQHKNKNISIVIQNEANHSYSGIVKFENLNIKTIPGTNITIILSGFFSAFPSQVIQKQELYLELNVQIRKCNVGEIIKSDFSCMKCPEKSYSLIDPMKVEIKYQKCTICPDNSHCFQGSLIIPLEGYYRFLNTSIVVVKCFSFESCLGGINEELSNKEKINLNGHCKPGNYGPLCSYCDDLYSKYERDTICKQCEELGVLIIIRIIIYSFFGTLYLLLNSHFASKYNENLGKSSNLDIYMKIIVNHFQQIGIIMTSGIDISWNQYFNDFFNLINNISLTDENVFTNECLFQHLFTNKNYLYMISIIINSFLPLAISILSFFIWFVYIYLKKKKIKNYFSFSLIFSKLKLFIVLSIFILYPLVIKSCLSLFNCMSLDPNFHESYLIIALEIVCWDKNHINFIIFFAFPGLFIWGFGFPIYLYLILKKNFKEKLYSKTITENNKNEEYSCFIKGYKNKFFFWESLIFFRKLFLSTISVLRNTVNVENKWFLILMILFLYLHFTILKMPYTSNRINKLEILSLLSCIFIVIVLNTINSKSSLFFKVFVVVLTAIVQLSFFFYFCFNIILILLLRRKIKLQNKKTLKSKFNLIINTKLKFKY